MTNNLVYIAIPFSHDNPYIESTRYSKLLHVINILVRTGLNPVCSLPMLYTLYRRGEEFSIEDIHRLTTAMVSKCSLLIVIQLSGWEESMGVKTEVEMARECNIPVRYVKPEELVTQLAEIKEIVSG